MKLTDMKRTKAEKAERNKPMATSPYEGDDYGYGLRLSLDSDALKKLGMKVSQFEVGDEVTIRAVAKITELSQNASSNSRNSRVELQVTKLGVACGEAEDALSAMDEGIEEADDED